MGHRVRVVTNQVFLLGLDDLYRERMKLHEAGELLACAQAVCGELQARPATGPVEGYYTENQSLTMYFQCMRALQAMSADKRHVVEHHPAFRRLLAVASSPMFGSASEGRHLFPMMWDPLTRALEAMAPNWTIERLTSAAHDEVASSDDFSLVGLAALAKDALVLAALRETTVLYAYTVAMSARWREPKFEWRVDDALADRANRFIATFNELFSERLPTAVPENAKRFWPRDADIIGRCVRLGSDDRQHQVRHYHWGITADRSGISVRDFWSEDLWTTERFRSALEGSGALPFKSA